MAETARDAILIMFAREMFSGKEANNEWCEETYQVALDGRAHYIFLLKTSQGGGGFICIQDTSPLLLSSDYAGGNLMIFAYQCQYVKNMRMESVKHLQRKGFKEVEEGCEQDFFERLVQEGKLLT